MHKLKARLHPTFALVCALLSSAACTDQFEGSNIQIDFGPFVPAQSLQDNAPLPGNLELPPTTHYRLYGIVETRDATGAVTAATYTELQRFEIHRIVETGSPCFIDPEEARFPGVHVTQFMERMRDETGIQDIKNPPAGASEEDKIDMATAIQRNTNMGLLTRDPNPLTGDGGGLKAVTSVSTGRYPGVAATCVEDDPNVDQTLIPPATCRRDDSNALRLKLCRETWARYPDLYEGTDRILSEPLSGNYFGVVIGTNPLNGAVLGGTQFFVEDLADDYNAYAITFQFDDANNDGAPDYPTGFTPPPVPPGAPADYGSQFMRGRTYAPTRGVTRALLPVNQGVFAQLAIFSDLGDDDVHF